MTDYNKIYIYTTGKNRNKIIFYSPDFPKSTQIQHPLPAFPVGDVTQENVDRLFEFTIFGTPNQILASLTFQDCLKNDWIKAYNEFGIEIDNYTTKLAPGSNFADGDTPVWDENAQQFIPEPYTPGGGPSDTVKRTKLINIQNLPSNQANRVDMTTLFFTFTGDIPNLGTDINDFNTNIKIIVEMNGIPLEKGTQVIRQSNNSLSFSDDIFIDDAIFIYS